MNSYYNTPKKKMIIKTRSMLFCKETINLLCLIKAK